MLKQNLTLLYVGGKILPIQTKSVKLPYKRPMVMSTRNGFDTFANVIHQQNGLREIMMLWFSRLKFCISRLKIRQ